MAELSPEIGFQEDAKTFDMQKFGGLNTKAKRPAISDEEQSWIENFLPIGDGNLRTMYGKGPNVYSATGGKTVIYPFFYNIGSTAYGVAFLSDGTAVQFNTATGAATTISAVANTFYNGVTFPNSLPGCGQWGSQYLLIVNNHTASAYWVWDGSLLYTAGTLAPSATFTITNVGSGYTPGTYALGFAGGGGTGAAGTYTIGAGGTLASIAVTNVGSGYTSAPTLSFPSGGGTLAAATATMMPTGVNGTSIETYQSRVWITSSNSYTFSAPGSFANFATSSGGGTTPSTDAFLKYAYTNIKQSNSFLYLTGDSSINVISNVQTTGSPATTTLNNQNADPQVGTSWRDSLVPFGRALIFANSSGVYAMFGGAAEKVSEKLDGIFSNSTIPLTGPNIPMSAIATVFGIKIYLLLIPTAVDYLGVTRPYMCAWDGKKWFVASQEVNLTFIATQEINSQLTAWGTDGTNLFKLFVTPSTTLNKIVQSKLWDGGSYLINKQGLRLYAQITDNSSNNAAVTVNVDNQSQSSQFSLSNSNTINFYNNLGPGNTIQFQNSSAQNIYFTTSGLAITGADAQSVFGLLLGMTLMTGNPDLTIISATLLYKDFSAYV